MLLYLILITTCFHMITNVATTSRRDDNYIKVLLCYLNVLRPVSYDELRVLVNEVGSDGLLPVHRSAYQGRADVVRALIQFRVRLAVLDSKTKKPPFIWAARGGSVEVLQLIRDVEPELIKWSDKDGSALNWATKERRLNAMRWLISHNLSLESRDGFHMTPLQTASYNGDLRSVELLLDHGADIESHDNYWWTPMFWSTANGHIDVVRLLLNRSAEVNRADMSGMTPLHQAAMGHGVHYTGDGTDLLRLLLDHGAHLEARSNSGFTALHYAVGSDRLHAAGYLLRRGADVNSVSYNGLAPLHLAASNGYWIMAEVLLDGGADVNAKDHDGRTPLYMAKGKYMVDFLKSRGGVL